MIAWRIARRPYADLSGEGARRFGGRWNSPAKRVVYMAEHPALAMLEILVHLDLSPELVPDDYVLMRVEWPDQIAYEAITQVVDDERSVGDEWLEAARSAILLVPSVILPHSFNLLLNCGHIDMSEIKFTVEPLAFDPRLFGDR